MINTQALYKYILKNVEIPGEYLHNKKSVLFDLHECDLEKVIKFIDTKKNQGFSVSYLALSAFITKYCKDKNYRDRELKSKRLVAQGKESEYVIDRMTKNSKNCLHCYAFLKKKIKEEAKDFAKRMFCGRSCATSFHNIKRGGIPIQNRQCQNIGCNNILTRRETETIAIFNKRKYCSRKCANESRAEK